MRRPGDAASRLAAAARHADLAGLDRAVVLVRAGTVAVRAGDASLAEEVLFDAEATSRAALERQPSDEARVALASTLTWLAYLALDRNEVAWAEELAAESLALRREARSERGVARSLELVGVIADRRGEVNAARTAYAEAVALSRRHDDVALVASTLVKLGLVEAGAGRADEARAHFREAVEAFEATSVVAAAKSAVEAACAARAQRWPDAEEMADSALDRTAAIGDIELHAWAERVLPRA